MLPTATTAKASRMKKKKKKSIDLNEWNCFQLLQNDSEGIIRLI